MIRRDFRPGRMTADLPAPTEEFLDNDWESVYQLVNPELAAALGDDIYKFDFSYRAAPTTTTPA